MHQVVRMAAVARPTAVIAETTTWPEYPEVWRRILDTVHANIRWGGTGRKGRNVMFYLDDTPRVEVGVELDQPAEFDPPLIRSELPAGDVAMTVHVGPYSELEAAHDAVWKWCEAQGVRILGPRWEV